MFSLRHDDRDAASKAPPTGCRSAGSLVPVVTSSSSNRLRRCKRRGLVSVRKCFPTRDPKNISEAHVGPGDAVRAPALLRRVLWQEPGKAQEGLRKPGNQETRSLGETAQHSSGAVTQVQRHGLVLVSLLRCYSSTDARSRERSTTDRLMRSDCMHSRRAVCARTSEICSHENKMHGMAQNARTKDLDLLRDEQVRSVSSLTRYARTHKRVEREGVGCIRAACAHTLALKSHKRLSTLCASPTWPVDPCAGSAAAAISCALFLSFCCRRLASRHKSGRAHAQAS